jgi:hypothetical protein
VNGQVLVDGQPVQWVQIKSQGLGPVDPNLPTASEAFTDEQGNFKFTTYEANDGMPAGEYKLTFVWQERVGKRFEGPDKLGGRYADPATSQFSVKVENGPVELPKFELTTK